MDEQPLSGTTENLENKVDDNPWVAAFAALEQKNAPATQAASDTANDTSAAPEQPGGAAVPNTAETGDNATSTDSIGGLDSSDRGYQSESSTAFADMQGVTAERIAQYEKEINEQIREQAIRDIAQEFIKRGIRNNNGRIGATIEDADICKRDADGVPHFYNPETGQEFRGDNPRRQALEWCEDYNKEVARAFNIACEKYEAHLKNEAAPSIAVMKFKEKYDKLDDIRKGMFDNYIEDYVIKNDQGKIIGYDCDLDKVLALVERQISTIQAYAKSRQPQTTAPQPQNRGPVLDMKTSSGAVASGDKPVTSLEEAMLRLQNEQLAKLKR